MYAKNWPYAPSSIFIRKRRVFAYLLSLSHAPSLTQPQLPLPCFRSRRRANAAALVEKLRLVHAVWATQPTIQQLMAARDFPGALELIASSQQLLATELTGISSLRRLGGSLAETKRLVTGMMSRSLLKLALGYDLEVGTPLHPAEALAAELDHRLLPLAGGLMRLRLLHEAIQSLEEQMLRDVRTLVKKKLSEQVASLEAAHSTGDVEKAAGPALAPAVDAAVPREDPSSKPARTVMVRVRELSPEGFEEVMGDVASALMVLLRRAAIIHAAILKTTASPIGIAAAADDDDASSATICGGSGGAVREADDCGNAYVEQVKAQSSEMLLHVCELSQERYARLLKVRREVHARLQLVDFVKMNASVSEFVRDVNHVSKHTYSTLSVELQAHAAEFLRVVHDGSTRRLALLLEVEQWKQVDAALEFQDIADAFVQKQVPTLAESQLMKLRENNVSARTESGAPLREIVVDGIGYKVVSSSLLLLAMVAHYMQCVSSLQTVGPQVANFLASLLKLFHTLCYKQVLMAGAMRPESAGLKSINFKHLALASQSLGLVLALVPHIKAILAAYVPEAQRAPLKEVTTCVLPISLRNAIHFTFASSPPPPPGV